MKQVRGYLTTDGMFFDDEIEAKKHEAEMAIRAYCVTHTPTGAKIANIDDPDVTLPPCIDADKFLLLTEAMADLITSYLDAYRKTSAPKPQVNEDSSENTEASSALVDQTDYHKTFVP